MWGADPRQAALTPSAREIQELLLQSETEIFLNLFHLLLSSPPGTLRLSLILNVLYSTSDCFVIIFTFVAVAVTPLSSILLLIAELFEVHIDPVKQ